MATITDNDGNEYPVRKQGAAWICQGPNGSFRAHSKREAERLLRETGGAYDEQFYQDNAARNARMGKGHRQ